MSITLDYSPEIEEELRAYATERGVSVEELAAYALFVLRDYTGPIDEIKIERAG